MKAGKLSELYVPRRGWITDLGTVDREDKFQVRLDNLPGEFEGQSGAVYQFSLDKKQDIFIVLKDLNMDLDLYLTFSNWDEVQLENQETQEMEFVYSDKYVPYIANSTAYSEKDEVIFARLAPGDYWVKVKNNNPFQDLDQLDTPLLVIDNKKFKKTTKIPNDKYLKRQWYLFNTGISAFFENSTDYAQAYYVFNDSFAPEVNGIIPNTDIFAPEAWNIQHDAKDVVVAVVDQGVDIDHPDLKNNIWINPGEIPGDGEDNDNNGFKDDVNGWSFNYGGKQGINDPRPFTPNHAHGTHVAGTIGAEGNNKMGISGVAWKTQIMPVNIGTNNVNGLAQVEKGIQYAVENDADIINLSLGTSLKISPAYVMQYMTSQGLLMDDTPSSIRETGLSEFIDVAQQALENDVLLVIAAGNDGRYSTKVNSWQQVNNLDDSFHIETFLSSFLDNAITVSSTDAMSNLSPYTNTGFTADISAPGGNNSGNDYLAILSTLPKGITAPNYSSKFVDNYNGTYGYADGTSMATPVVSGSAALIKAVNPKLNASEIRQVILSSARSNPKFKGQVGDHGLQLFLPGALELARNWEGRRSLFQLHDGSSDDDTIRASSYPSLIRGYKGNDILSGNRGDDFIHGGPGDDLILPGKGKDTIRGGKGVDTILYLDPDDSPIYKPDVVDVTENDLFDLSAFAGDKKLKWVGDAEFANKDRVQVTSRRNGFFVEMNGDKLPDFAVLYDTVLDVPLTQDNFIF